MHGYKITSTIYKISNRDFYLLLQDTIQKKNHHKKWLLLIKSRKRLWKSNYIASKKTLMLFNGNKNKIRTKTYKLMSTVEENIRFLSWCWVVVRTDQPTDDKPSQICDDGVTVGGLVTAVVVVVVSSSSSRNLLF